MKALFKRIGQIVGAWGLMTILFVVFDDFLYPTAIFTWGPVKGGVIMASTAVLINIVMLISYERSGTDWLGVNVVEDIKKEGEERVEKFDSWFKTQFKKSFLLAIGARLLYVLYYPFTRGFLIVLWALKKNDVLAFIVLNITQDPFVTAVFLRHGRFDGLRKKDWLIFVGSVLFSNTYWIIRSTILVKLVVYGYNLV